MLRHSQHPIPSRQPFQRMLWLASLCLFACDASEPVEEGSDLSEPTPEPSPSLRKTTWATFMTEEVDPTVQAMTCLFINVETQENGRITGWIWHTWGELTIDGYEVPEREVVALEGTYDWERHLTLRGSLYGHTAILDGFVWEQGQLLELELTLDDGVYEWASTFTPHDYVTVNPQ